MHGETKRYHHKYVGGNFRIDALQAGILSIKLDYLDQQHKGRKNKTRRFITMLFLVKFNYLSLILVAVLFTINIL